MDLLTQVERNLIKDAIKDITDTFCNTPVSFLMPKSTSSRWGDADRPQFQAVEALCYVEYPQTTTFDAMPTPSGVKESYDISCMMNVSVALTSNLIKDSATVLLKAGTKFMCEGKEYYVQDCFMEGAFQRQNLIFTVIGIQVNR